MGQDASFYLGVPALFYEHEGRPNSDPLRHQDQNFEFAPGIYDPRPEDRLFSSVVDSYPSPPESGYLNHFSPSLAQDRCPQLAPVSACPFRSQFRDGYRGNLPFPPAIPYYDVEDADSVYSSPHYGGYDAATSPVHSVGTPEAAGVCYSAPHLPGGGGFEPLTVMSARVLQRGRDFINPREVQHFPEPDGQDLDLLVQPEPVNCGGAVQSWSSSDPAAPLDHRTPLDYETPLDHRTPLSPPSEADDDPAADESETSVFSPTARARGKLSRRHARRASRARRGPAVTMSSRSSTGAVRAPRARRASNGGAGAGAGGRGGSRVSAAGRPFPCPLAPYGCEATFPSKNEWKRHVGTQHVKLGLWRCALCRRPPQASAAAAAAAAAAAGNGEAPATPPTQHNDFNRKDLFTQHLRRMHPRALARVDPSAAAPDDIDADVDEDAEDDDAAAAAAAAAAHPPGGGPAAAASLLDEEDARAARLAHEDAAVNHLVSRCFLTLRPPPTRCGCPLCDARFEGANAWDARIDHLAAHWENARRSGHRAPRTAQWRPDQDLEEYLIEEGLIEAVGGGWRIGKGVSRRARKMGWF